MDACIKIEHLGGWRENGRQIVEQASDPRVRMVSPQIAQRFGEPLFATLENTQLLVCRALSNGCHKQIMAFGTAVCVSFSLPKPKHAQNNQRAETILEALCWLKSAWFWPWEWYQFSCTGWENCFGMAPVLHSQRNSFHLIAWRLREDG